MSKVSKLLSIGLSLLLLVSLVIASGFFSDFSSTGITGAPVLVAPSPSPKPGVTVVPCSGPRGEQGFMFPSKQNCPPGYTGSYVNNIAQCCYPAKSVVTATIPPSTYSSSTTKTCDELKRSVGGDEFFCSADKRSYQSFSDAANKLGSRFNCIPNSGEKVIEQTETRDCWRCCVYKKSSLVTTTPIPTKTPTPTPSPTPGCASCSDLNGQCYGSPTTACPQNYGTIGKVSGCQNCCVPIPPELMPPTPPPGVNLLHSTKTCRELGGVSCAMKNGDCGNDILKGATVDCTWCCMPKTQAISTTAPISVSPQNLVPTQLDVKSSEVSAGGELLVDTTVRNIGSKASPQSLVRFFMLPSTGSEILVAAAQFPPIQPGQSSLLTKKITIPRNINSGTMKLKVLVDPDKNTGDADYSNNEKISTTPIKIIGGVISVPTPPPSKPTTISSPTLSSTPMLSKPSIVTTPRWSGTGLRTFKLANDFERRVIKISGWTRSYHSTTGKYFAFAFTLKKAGKTVWSQTTGNYGGKKQGTVPITLTVPNVTADTLEINVFATKSRPPIDGYQFDVEFAR